jgi:hypothetical protein
MDIAAAWLIGRASIGRRARRGFRCPPGRASSGKLRRRASHAGTSEATGNGRGPRSAPLVASISRSTSRPVRCFRSLFSLLRPFIILSRVSPVRCPGNPHKQGRGFQSIDKIVYFVEREFPLPYGRTCRCHQARPVYFSRSITTMKAWS